MSLQKSKNYILKIGLTLYLNQTKLETKTSRLRLVLDHYNKNLNSDDFRETNETDYSSNKNDPQSSLGNSNHTN